MADLLTAARNLIKYARHMPRCHGVPCSCGYLKAIDEFAIAVPPPGGDDPVDIMADAITRIANNCPVTATHIGPYVAGDIARDTIAKLPNIFIPGPTKTQDNEKNFYKVHD